MNYADRHSFVLMPEWESGVRYPKGACVRMLDNFYCCNLAHVSEATFKDTYWTKINSSEGGGESLPVLTEIVKTLAVSANSITDLDLAIPTNKCDIRTVYVETSGSGSIQFSIFNSATNGFCVYSSMTEPKIYDIANVPYQDKDLNKLIHGRIMNAGSSNINVKIILNVISLA